MEKVRDPMLYEVRQAIDDSRERVLEWFREMNPELGPSAKPERFDQVLFGT